MNIQLGPAKSINEDETSKHLRNTIYLSYKCLTMSMKNHMVMPSSILLFCRIDVASKYQDWLSQGLIVVHISLLDLATPSLKVHDVRDFGRDKSQ